MDPLPHTFLAAVFFLVIQEPHHSKAIISLSQVNKHWRSTSLCYANLWVQLLYHELDKPSFSHSRMLWVTELFERTKPLSLDIGSGLTSPNAFSIFPRNSRVSVELESRNIHRLRTYHASLDQNGWERFLNNAMEREAPNLESLALSFVLVGATTSKGLTRNSIGAQSLPFNLFDGRAPRLHSVSLRGLTLEASLSDYAYLRHLRVLSVVLPSCMASANRPTLAHWVHHVSAMPYLENLVLVDAIAPSSTTHVSPILFPYLSRLRLRARLDDISAFLSCAQFPSGCTLSLTCYDIRDGREFQRLREVFLTRWASSVSPSECSPYSSPFIVVSDGRNLTVTNNLVSGEHRYHDDDDGVPPTSTPVEQTQARQAQFYLQLYPKFKFDHYSKHDWPKLLSSLLNSDAMVSVIADATCFQLGLPFIPIVLVESLKMAKRATHLVNVGELALVALYPILRRELASPSSFGMGVMTVTSPGSTDDCILPALKVLRIEARTLHSHYLPVVVLALSRRSLGWGGIKRIVVGGFAFGTQAGGEEREERLLTRGALLDVPWEVNSPTLRTLAEYGVQVFHTSLYS